MQLLLTLSTLLASTMAFPAANKQSPKEDCDKKAAFFLAGDSTTAQTAVSGGGWGNGFLTTLKKGSFGMNYGHNGADTNSFRAGGDWGRVLAQVNKSVGLDYEAFVTIQFGHNDQKVAKNISVDLFKSNLKQMVLDVKGAGGIPILVTSLTRRKFNTSEVIVEDLIPQVNATIAVAKAMRVAYIDLNRASTAYANAIGRNMSATYNLIPTDYTHLNANGAMLFGNMVSALMEKSVKEAREFTSANQTIVKAIEKGKYMFPDLPTTAWTNSTAPAGFSY